MLDGGRIDGTDLPLLEQIFLPIPEPLLLLFLANIQVVFQNLNSGTDQHMLER